MERQALIRRALRLEALTLGWMAVEAGVALAAARKAHSLTLSAFGADSVVEFASALLLMWRLRVELIAGEGFPEATERRAARIAGGLLLGLAIVVAAGAAFRLWSRTGQAFSVPGLAVAAAAVPVMAWLARAKLRLAARLESGALRADAIESFACLWLSIAVIADLIAQALLGAWWVDAAGATLLLPFLVKEGLEGWRDDDRCSRD